MAAKPIQQESSAGMRQESFIESGREATRGTQMKVTYEHNRDLGDMQ